MPFRNDLDAAEAREDVLERELEQARKHADELRARQDDHGAEQPSVAKKPTKARWGWKKKLALLSGPLVVFGIFVLLPAFANVVAGSCGYRQVVLNAVSECPAASERLGTKLRFGYVGMGCGTTSMGSERGDLAEWRMPIVGSRGSGVVRFLVTKQGGSWGLARGNVEVDGQTIDLRNCEPGQIGNADSVDSAPSVGGAKPASPAGILARKCESGNARACRDLAQLYEIGNSVEKNAETAARYNSEACRLGLDVACAAAKSPSVP